MKKKVDGKFHIGDVLSITTGLLVSPDRMDGVYQILDYMTGDSLFTHQLGRAADNCKPYLLKQFPWLDTDEFDDILDKLKDDLGRNKSSEGEMAKKTSEWIVNLWLKNQVIPKTGEFVKVEKLPQDSGYRHKDPIKEAITIMGDPKKVIVVGMDKKENE